MTRNSTKKYGIEIEPGGFTCSSIVPLKSPNHVLFGFYSKVAGIFKRANLICNPKYRISSTFLLLHSLLSTQISLQFHYLDNLWPTGKRIHAGTHYISCHDWRPLSINLVLRKYLTASPYAYSLHDVSYTPFPWTSYISISFSP